MTDLKKLYETDVNFRRYVDAYARKQRVSIDAALAHKMIKAYAESCTGATKDGTFLR